VTLTTHDRPAPPVTVEVAHDVRPVMLLTLNVPFDEAAVEFAIDTAAETGAELWICDAIPMGFENYVGHVARQYAEQLNRKHTNAVARQSRDRGVRTSQVAFHNPKPVKAAIEVARNERIGLLVFGSDRSALGRWTFRRAVRRLRDEATCLVWTSSG
jgi:nucleotide-binding universal stress UspA family protein